ncbi:transmembrane protein [Cystoisospora suis]|uniref:Transmembrane protein n=1 Tax=Cystoisospora suis TaxID=483139 RepID=A0A2C6JZZ1_9APIC|nr:transmembrane protein [Cystoisospora suis]
MAGTDSRPLFFVTLLVSYLVVAGLPVSWASTDGNASETKELSVSSSESDGQSVGGEGLPGGRVAGSSLAVLPHCSRSPVSFPPQGTFNLVITDREALGELGVNFVEPTGKPVFPVFPNALELPSLNESLDAKEIRQEEDRLKSKGFFLPTTKYIALQRAGNSGILTECGACRSAGYLFSIVESKEDDPNGTSIYFMYGVTYPSLMRTGPAFSIPAHSLVVQGEGQVSPGSLAVLACTQAGDAPVLFPDPLSNADQAPLYRPGPFKESVEVLNAEALQGPSPSSSLLKARLILQNGGPSVAHTFPGLNSFLYFGKIPPPALSESAYVLSSLRTRPDCTLERQDEKGPVVLSCKAWTEFKERLDARAAAAATSKRVKRARAVTAGVLGAVALASGGLAYGGYRTDSSLSAFTTPKLGRMNKEFSRGIKAEGVTNPVFLKFADSVHPENMGMALSNLSSSRRSLEGAFNDVTGVRRGSAALLMRGAGTYGLAAAAVAALASLPLFLAEAGVRAGKSGYNNAALRSHVRKTVQKERVDRPGGSEETFLFLIT